MNVKVYRHRACKATTKCRTRWNGGTHGPAYPHPHEERDKVALHCGDESNESDVAAKAASLLSRGAAGRVAQLQFQMMCERPPRSLRSRLPLREGESRRRRQGVAHTSSGIAVGQHARPGLAARGYILPPLRGSTSSRDSQDRRDWIRQGRVAYRP